MNVMDAIYGRRSIRRYKNDQVAKETIEELLEAATMAPSASNTQPWSFVVIHDRELLRSYSDRAKAMFLDIMADKPDPNNYKPILANPQFNMFYDAGSLIIIYSSMARGQALGDCSIAAQNLMLAAFGKGLGSCWIGFSVPFFDSAEFKKEVGVSDSFKAVAPIILGYPEVNPENYTRKSPKVLAWI